MKFYGTPNMTVFEINKNPRDRKNIFRQRKRLFQFDKNGEFETDNAELIKKLKRKFKHEETKVCAETVKPLESAPTEKKLRHCKKCDFACETQGELLKHYREKHPKGAK